MQPIARNHPADAEQFNISKIILASARSVLLPVIIGWLWALAISFVLAQIQANEIARSFLPARLDVPPPLLLTVHYVPTDIMARLDFEIRRGSLLLLSQVGIVSGVLAWQVSLTAHHLPKPRLYGTLCGGLVGVVEAGIGVIMGAPLTFSIPLGVALLTVGLYVGFDSINDSKATLTVAS